MNYTLIYDQETGVCVGIAAHYSELSVPILVSIIPEDVEYQKFLQWNAAQPIPLDTTVPDPVIAARYAAKQQSLAGILPSWTQVETACNNISDLPSAKAFIKKLARVVYWLAKNSES